MLLKRIENPSEFIDMVRLAQSGIPLLDVLNSHGYSHQVSNMSLVFDNSMRVNYS